MMHKTELYSKKYNAKKICSARTELYFRINIMQKIANDML